MKRSRFHITDHAVLRYLERVQGVDTDAVRAEIAKTVEIAEGHPECGGVNSNGFSYRLTGNTVTTIIRLKRPNALAGRKKRS